MSALYSVKVSSLDKGEIFKLSGRWRWQLAARGTETYSRKHRLLNVREHIARLCGVRVGEVRLSKKSWSEGD